MAAALTLAKKKKINRHRTLKAYDEEAWKKADNRYSKYLKAYREEMTLGILSRTTLWWKENRNLLLPEKIPR